MKNLKRVGAVLLSMVIFSTALLAQESEKKLINVSCDSGLKILAIDGVEIKKKSNVKVEEGVHTFEMNYDKYSLLNETRTSSNGTFEGTYEFIPGYDYVLRMYIADNMTYRVIPRIVSETMYVSSFKSVRKPVEVQELPRKIDFIKDYPTDRKYEILGNVTFTAGYVPKVYKERTVDGALYELGVRLQSTEADAIIYCYVRDQTTKKGHVIDGMAIKYIDDVEETAEVADAE